MNQIDYRDLHPGQWEVAQSDRRFRFVVCGRGWGKDFFAISDTLRAVTQPRAGPGFLAAYVGPSHQQVRRIAWERWKRAIPRHYLAKPPHETNLELRLKWGPTIMLAGSDNVDALRGPDIHHLVITEFAFCRPTLWMAIRPGLRTSQDRALIITTPAGPNHCWDLWKRVQDDPDWHCFTQPTWANPFHDAAAVEEARRTLSNAQFDQEYGAQFEALTGAIYADFSVSPGGNVLRGSAQVELDRSDTIWVGQDFNAGLISAVIGQARGDELFLTDELVTRTHIHDHVRALQAFFERRGIDWRRRVNVCIDASGEYNATNRVQSDAVIMRRAGFRTRHARQNPAVIDRIHSVQALILNGEGRRRLHVNERCAELINCLLNQTYNQWHKPDKTKGLDHLPDALGYLCWELFPIVPQGTIE